MDTDARIVAALADRRPEAFADLVGSYQHRLFAFTFSMLGDRSDAEEAAQDTFVRAHRALARYDRDRILDLRLSGWLHTIALNSVRNRVRSRKPSAVALDVLPDGRGPAASGPGPERAYEIRSELQRLAELVAALPPGQRNAVALHCVQGFSHAEASVVLGVSEVTVRSNLHRGLAALRARAGWLKEVS